MTFSQKYVQTIKKAIVCTPFNRNYIAESCLRKSMEEASPYVNGLVLDIGCGEKPYKPVFANVQRYIGLDSPKGYMRSSHIDIYGDGCALPFKTETFSSVICTQVLSHIERPHRLVGEVARVLKEGGILVLTEAKSWERRTGLPIPDFFRFTDEGLARLAERAGLAVVYTKEGCGFFAMAGQQLTRFLTKEFIYRKALYAGVDTPPNILAAVFILPICALVQSVFLLLDKVYYSKLDTLFYILVACKPKQAQ